MNWYKSAQFSPKELVNIGYALMDLGNYNEDTGNAFDPEDTDLPKEHNFIDTRNIVNLGRYLCVSRGNPKRYTPNEGEISGTIRELQNMISINPTLVQPFDDGEIRDIKILISKLDRMGKVWNY